MPTTLPYLATRDTTQLLHEIVAAQTPNAAATFPDEAVQPLLEAGLVQSQDGQNLYPVNPSQATKIIQATIDDWLPGVLDNAA